MKKVVFLLLTVGLVLGAGARNAEACCGPYEDPPAIRDISCSPNLLWPPNHKYIEVEVSPVVLNTDTWQIVGVFSDQPDDAEGVGDGQTVNDCTIMDRGPLDPTMPQAMVELRAERCGVRARQGVGRTYTIVLEAWNSAGLVTGSCTVYVPHDQKEKES